MKTYLRYALALSALALAVQASAQVTFFEHEGFNGQSFTTQRQVGNFERFGFNDRASSVVVSHDRWEVCDDAGFSGRCVILRQGRYPSLAAMGLNDRVSSVRMVSGNARVDDERPPPFPVGDRDYRRRQDERLFEADVTSVHAVVGPPEQRCWVEHEQVVRDSGGNNKVGGAIAGALLGGILGHQVGGGSGRDIATAGGAVAGAAIGANVARDSNGREVTTQDVQRCANTGAPSRPEYWDVTYNFRGQEHRVQMTSRPGATVTVNRQGEPRS
jgi:uncharacterized protein YcfJ